RGSFLGTAVTTRMVQFLQRNAVFRQLLSDLFCGTQDYTTLKQRVLSHLGGTLSQFVNSVLRFDHPSAKTPASDAWQENNRPILLSDPRVFLPRGRAARCEPPRKPVDCRQTCSRDRLAGILPEFPWMPI